MLAWISYTDLIQIQAKSPSAEHSIHFAVSRFFRTHAFSFVNAQTVNTQNCKLLPFHIPPSPAIFTCHNYIAALGMRGIRVNIWMNFIDNSHKKFRHGHTYAPISPFHTSVTCPSPSRRA